MSLYGDIGVLKQICPVQRCSRPTFNAKEDERGKDALLHVPFLEDA